MNGEPQSRPNLWLQLLRDAVAEEAISDGPHFMDDDEVLDRWENQELSAHEREAIVAIVTDESC